MKILFFPESATWGYPVKEFLESEGHIISFARDIYEANHYLQQANNAFDAIIVGLRVSWAGLKTELQVKTADDWITGWVWIEQTRVKKERVIILGN